MQQEEKDQILIQAKTQVKETCSLLDHTFQDLAVSVEMRKEDFKHDRITDDKLIFTRLLSYDETRLEELDHLKDSPYFVKCRIKKEGSSQEEDWFFGKFGYKESSIFSWITPAASIRFEKPGTFSYAQPDGKIVRGTLSAKEQYMIVHGKILFLATESLEQERELIYQEHFSTHKTGFVLPEIVAQMEKAQDQVIRADHKGSFVISGPAGSGKTTLALHRIAYLVQSPETSEQFPTNSIIVFVQDTSTQDYFSHLLPELGIKHVQITTFAQWALTILGLTDIKYVDRFGMDESEKDAFEQAKLGILHTTHDPLLTLSKNPFIYLKKVYDNALENEQLDVFKRQTKALQLDRFDLTLLLNAFHATHGELTRTKEYYQELNNGTLKKKIGRLPITYSSSLSMNFKIISLNKLGS
ncbi:hypothetical protein HQ487_01990 [Candidatus Uhrbacteria bacterium]|nr:hypothetical protein [Candidatus Uhrbacteria bacterium]